MSEEIRKIECEKAIRQLLEYLDHELDRTSHSEMENHLHTCRSCYSRMEFEKRLKEMVKEKKEKTASESLRSRIRSISKSFS